MHPGTFNANPVSAAAGVAMLRMVQTGEHHTHADALNAAADPGMNAVSRAAGAPGASTASRRTSTSRSATTSPRPSNGIEWPGDGAAAAARRRSSDGASSAAMLNHGVDLMHGDGGFVSGVHTDADIDAHVEAFEATLGEHARRTVCSSEALHHPAAPSPRLPPHVAVCVVAVPGVEERLPVLRVAQRARTTAARRRCQRRPPGTRRQSARRASSSTKSISCVPIPRFRSGSARRPARRGAAGRAAPAAR